LDNEFNWEERFSEQKEDQLYKAVPKLWPIGEVILEKLHFFKKNPKQIVVYNRWRRKMIILYIFTNMNMKRR
jgi:hypothetical protein